MYALDWVVLELQRPIHGCGAAGWQVSVTHDAGHTSVKVVVVEEIVHLLREALGLDLHAAHSARHRSYA